MEPGNPSYSSVPASVFGRYYSSAPRFFFIDESREACATTSVLNPDRISSFRSYLKTMYGT